MRIDHTDIEHIKQLLVGRSVVKIEDDILLLDDGQRIRIQGNEGCGGCSEGWYDLTHLADSINGIMDVTIVVDEVGNNERYNIFVMTHDQQLAKLASVEGHDNGWYGSGFWIDILEMPQ